MPSSDWRDEIFWWQVWCLGTRLLVTVLVYFVLEILESRFFVGYQNPKDVTKIFTVSTTFKNQLFVTNISVTSVNNISPTKTVKSVTKTQTCYHHISTLTPRHQHRCSHFNISHPQKYRPTQNWLLPLITNEFQKPFHFFQLKKS